MLQYGNGSKVQRPKRISYKRRRKISEFIIDETQIRVGNKYFWIWIAAIEPTEKSILDIFEAWA
jgi:transposase-like protein